MSKTITLSDSVFERLASRAVGFDSPEQVIQRLLDQVEFKADHKPSVSFIPSEEAFKEKLIETKRAEITLYKMDGSREVTIWNARRFNDDSRLRANLWSGYLRNWKDKGIVKAELEVLPRGTNTPDEDTEWSIWCANKIGLRYSEMLELEGLYEKDTLETHSGNPNGYSLTFYDEAPKDILSLIADLQHGNYVAIYDLFHDEDLSSC